MINILLIEDDLVDQKIFTRYLELIEEPIELIICKTLSETHEILNSKSFDLIFCDYNLPDGSAINFLQDSQVPKSVPKIIVTGQTDSNMAAELLKNGAFNLISKPLDKEGLIKVISEFSFNFDLKPVTENKSIDFLGFPNLTRLANGDFEFAKKIVNTIFRNLSDEVELFQTACQENNCEEIKYWPHKMRSSFIILGYDELQELSIKIEMSKTSIKERELFTSLLRDRINELALTIESLNE